LPLVLKKKRRILPNENDERGPANAFIKPMPKLRTVSAAEGKNLPRSLPRDGKRYEKVEVRYRKPKKRKKTPVLSAKEGKGLPKVRPKEGKWEKVKVDEFLKKKTKKVIRRVEVKLSRPPKLSMKTPNKENVQQHLMSYFSEYMKKLEKKYANHSYLLPSFRAWLIDDTSKNIIEACKDEMKSPVEVKKMQANGVQDYAKAVLQLLQEKYLAEQEKKLQDIPAQVENHIASLTPKLPETQPNEKLNALPQELKARIEKAKEHLSTKEMEEFELQERLLKEKKQREEKPYLPKNLLFPAAKLKTKLFDLACFNDIIKDSLESGRVLKSL